MTKKEVAEFFHVSLRAIDNWVADGKLKQCKVPGDPRFNPEYIHSLAFADLESSEYTPWRCRKLERENKELKEKINRLMQVFQKIEILTAETKCEILNEK